MTRPAGRALLEIIGDVSKLGQQLSRDASRAIAQARIDLRPVTQAIERGVAEGAEAFGELDDEAREAFHEIGRQADRAFEDVEREADEAGNRIGREIQDGGETAERGLKEVGDRAKREFDRVEREADQAGNNIGATFRRLGTIIAGAFAAVQVGQFIRDAIMQASDLGESVNAITVVLQEGAESFLEFGKTAADQLGITQAELNAAVVPIAALLRNAGSSGEVLSGQLQTIATRATDVASVFNRDVNDVLLAFGAALRGEQEPIRAFGVNLDQASIAAKAVELGLAASEKEVTKAAATQAAYALILEQTAVAQGDFQNTAESLPNLMRRISAVFAESAAALGSAMLPALSEIGASLLPVITEITPVFGQLGEGLADVVESLGPALSDVIAGLVAGLQSIAPAISPVGAALGQLLSAFAPLLPVIGQLVATLLPPLATVVTAVATALAPLIATAAEFAAGLLDELAPVLAPIAQLLADVARELGQILLPIIEAAAPVVLALWRAFTPLVPVLLDVLRAVLPLAEPLLGLVNAVLPLVEALLPLVDVIGQLLVLSVQVSAPIIELAAALLALLANEAVVPLIQLIAEALAAVLSPLELLLEPLSQFSEFLEGVDWGKVGKAIGDAFAKAWDAVVDFFVGIGRWFAELPGRIGSFLSSLPGLMVRLFNEAFDQTLRAIGVAIGLTIAAIKVVPGKILDGLRALPGLLINFVQSAFTATRDTATSRINELLDFVRQIPGRIASFLAALPGVLAGAFVAALNAARTAAVNGFNAILDFIRSVPGRIMNLRQKMIDAGLALIRGFTSGLQRVGGFIGDVAGSIVNAIKSFLNRVIDRINEGIASVDANLPFVSLPRIPRLQTGGLTTAETLAHLHPQEVVLPLRDRRATDLLARALAEAEDQMRELKVPGVVAPNWTVIVEIDGQQLEGRIVDVINEHDRTLRRLVGARRR